MCWWFFVLGAGGATEWFCRNARCLQKGESPVTGTEGTAPAGEICAHGGLSSRTAWFLGCSEQGVGLIEDIAQQVSALTQQHRQVDSLEL